MLIESRPYNVFGLHLYLWCAYWNHVNYIVIIIWMISLMSNKSVEHIKTLLFTELGLTNKLCWRLDMGVCKPQVIIHSYTIVSKLQKMICWHIFSFQGTVWSKFLEINLHPNLKRLGIYLTLAEIRWHSERLLWKPCILSTLSTIEVLSFLLRWRCDSCHPTHPHPT